MQHKIFNQDIDSKKERQLMLDIMKIKESEPQPIIPSPTHTHSHSQSHPPQVPPPPENPSQLQSESSLSLHCDTIDSNLEIYNYELKIKSLALQNLHQKLVTLSWELETEKLKNLEMTKEIGVLKESRQGLVEENFRLK